MPPQPTQSHALGDVINLLDTISVRVGGRTNPITEDFYELQNWLDSSIEDVVETMETQYCQVGDKYALALSMEPGFCANGYEYEHTDEDGDTWLPCISLRYYSSYGCPEDWQYVREDDNQDAPPIAEYVVSDQKEQTEVIEWIRKDLDQHLNIKS